MSPAEQVRTDAQVVAASLHDPAQFAALYDRHAGDIHRYLLRRLAPTWPRTSPPTRS